VSKHLRWLWSAEDGSLNTDTALLFLLFAVAGYMWYTRVGGEAQITEGLHHWAAWSRRLLTVPR
jgi:hypothetical protein